MNCTVYATLPRGTASDWVETGPEPLGDSASGPRSAEWAGREARAPIQLLFNCGQTVCKNHDFR